MGVYIKGLNKRDISDLRVHKYGGAYEFVEHEDIIEVKTPHGRLIDESQIQTVYGEAMTTRYQGYISRTEKITHTDAPTVIEAEVE